MASNKYVRYKKVMQSLCPTEVDMYREAFNFFDKSRKGYIVADDFERALKRINQVTQTPTTREEAESLVREYDVNGDGKVTFEELVVSIVKRKETKDKDSELQKLFQSFDCDSDGVLNRDELVALLNSLGDKVSATDTEEILADFDENDSGSIQYNEFSKIMKQLV
ncbi:calmodulin-like isoform X2 [Ostrea edulis]|uniref:calmodulin-like isoform X2 n=1 Tax=Ostrea edulis TaxID=37623 RepID=UPI0024AF0128|nr:calmodulin-like isoform X2 [Ostrea edulis]